MKKLLLTIVPVFSALVVGTVQGQAEPLRIVATTSLIADVAQNVAGEGVEVSALLPPNTDTHSYEMTPNDLARAADADLLLINGAGYETFLANMLANIGDVSVVVVSSGVPILPYAEDHAHEGEDVHEEDETLGRLNIEIICEGTGIELIAASTEEAEEGHDHGVCDPHVWMDPENVMIWAENIAIGLGALDPDNAEQYSANAEAYQAELQTLDAELFALVDTLPEDQRVLITNHEFLGYFAHAYDFTIAASLLGTSTGSEVNPADLIALADQIENTGVRAIFAETTANPQLAQTLANETGITVVGTLYSEALSAADGPAATYLDFMRYNTQTIVDALR